MAAKLPARPPARVPGCRLGQSSSPSPSCSPAPTVLLGFAKPHRPASSVLASRQVARAKSTRQRRLAGCNVGTSGAFRGSPAWNPRGSTRHVQRGPLGPVGPAGPAGPPAGALPPRGEGGGGRGWLGPAGSWAAGCRLQMSSGHEDSAWTFMTSH